jgi:hypothetical protein
LICASIVGCQLNLAKKHRQGGNEKRNSELLIVLDAEMGRDIDMTAGRKNVIEMIRVRANRAAVHDQSRQAPAMALRKPVEQL